VAFFPYCRSFAASPRGHSPSTSFSPGRFAAP
jgi:hypothetical protein